MTIRSDLEKATGVKAKKTEDAAAFRLRLIEAVSALDDEDYEALPKAARSWSDDAIRDYEKDRKLEDIPDFPAEKETTNKKPKAAAEPEPEEDELDLGEETDDESEEGTDTESESDGDEADDDEDADDEQEEEVTHTDVAESTSRKRTAAKSKVAAKAAKGKGKKAAPAKPEKVTKAKKAKVAEGGKGLDFARSVLAKDISVSATDLREKVAAAGYEVSDSTLSTGASGFRAAVRALQKAGKLKSNMLD
jgi:hypothetical protein